MDFTEKTKRYFKILFMGNAGFIVLALFTIIWCRYITYPLIRNPIFFDKLSNQHSFLQLPGSLFLVFAFLITVISLISMAAPSWMLYKTFQKDAGNLTGSDKNSLSILKHKTGSGIYYVIVMFLYVLFAVFVMGLTDYTKQNTVNMPEKHAMEFISAIYSMLSAHFITLLLIFMFYTSVFIMSYQIKKKLIIFIRHDKGLSPSRD